MRRSQTEKFSHVLESFRVRWRPSAIGSSKLFVGPRSWRQHMMRLDDLPGKLRRQASLSTRAIPSRTARRSIPSPSPMRPLRWHEHAANEAADDHQRGIAQARQLLSADSSDEASLPIKISSPRPVEDPPPGSKPHRGNCVVSFC